MWITAHWLDVLAGLGIASLVLPIIGHACEAAGLPRAGAALRTLGADFASLKDATAPTAGGKGGAP